MHTKTKWLLPLAMAFTAVAQELPVVEAARLPPAAYSHATPLTGQSEASYVAPAAFSSYRALSPEHTAEQRSRTLYRLSLVAVMAANVADAASSWNRPETNLLLARPGGNFGMRSVAIKSGLVGSSLLIEHIALRHNRGLYRPFAWMNFAVAGGLGWAVHHNLSLR